MIDQLQREIEALERLANDPLADINEAYGARLQAYFLRNGYRLVPQMDGRTTRAVHMETGKASGRVITNKELYYIGQKVREIAAPGETGSDGRSGTIRGIPELKRYGYAVVEFDGQREYIEFENLETSESGAINGKD